MDSRNYHVPCKRASPSSSSAITEQQDLIKEQKTIMEVRYKECLKNHAASLGGHATDGCGEFISTSSSEEEAFKCSACNCHRNFHRKEIQFCYNSSNSNDHNLLDHLLLSPNNNKTGSNVSDQSHDDHHGEEEEDDRNYKEEEEGEKKVVKKRFRSKFSGEQKEKMARFAEKVGWKMQKVEESMVDKFCEEIGIKRRVLRVWMHNNKNTYHNAKSNL